jgi:hypothetical protein
MKSLLEISQSCLADKLNDFTSILVALPEYEVITRDKHFLDLVSFGMSAAVLTLATFNTAKISYLEMQIVHNNKRLDHLVDITTLHEQHFKAIDKKLDDVSDKLAMLLKINKVHFAKMTNFMEQNFGTTVAISECLIRTAYSNRLSPGGASTWCPYSNSNIRQWSGYQQWSFVLYSQTFRFILVETSYIYQLDEKTFVLVLHVPLVRTHNLMPLFELIPLSVYFKFTSNITITPEVESNNMIAVGHSESYQLLSSSDLQNCNKLGDTYFCKGRNVLL